MGKNILIIDDDSQNIFALTAVLKAKKFECLSATSAEVGIELIKKNKDIKIVLMDMMMPGTDGYEAIQIIRNDDELRQLTIIAVTAQAMSGDREKCLEAGADAYISKPVDADKLIEILNNYI